jgi:hypothetical protein
MPYVSENYDHNAKAPLGEWVTDPWGGYYGQCVSYVKQVVPNIPSTSAWVRGLPAKGNANIKAGTVIATFDAKKKYYGHAAIYESQDAGGLSVVDQWIVPPGPQPIHRRVLKFGGEGLVNDGDQFFVVE